MCRHCFTCLASADDVEKHLLLLQMTMTMAMGTSTTMGMAEVTTATDTATTTTMEDQLQLLQQLLVEDPQLQQLLQADVS